MKLPEGEERQTIQAAISAWSEAPASFRTPLEYGIYAGVRKYLPDMSNHIGFLATIAPSLVDMLLPAKTLDSEDVVIWADDADEIQIGTPKDPPDDAIRIPYKLLKKLLTIHTTDWAATASMEDIQKNPDWYKELGNKDGKKGEQNEPR